MEMTTLRGVFPEKQVVHRRNFIKENVRRIRMMQEMTQHISDLQVQEKQGKLVNGSSSPKLVETEKAKELGALPPQQGPWTAPRKVGVQRLDIRSSPRKGLRASQVLDKQDERITHRSMQTEHNDNVNSIYSSGTIRYASPAVVNALQKSRRSPHRRKDHSYGDSLHNTEGGEARTDFVKQNMIMKNKTAKPVESARPAYKKGVVPKYIRQRKEAIAEDTADVDCPDGHILLPEEERKETLRVLRESYAEKIQELNVMPVRSDTLRMQKRKMELEEELRKIDEGIKVFQRPKVFVKINV